MLKIYNKNINLNKNICITFIYKLIFISIWRGTELHNFYKNWN